MDSQRSDQEHEALAALEARQRAEIPAPGAPVRRETTRVRIPGGGELPESGAWLERLYAGELVPREKKPQVVDTRRSHGPFMASVDGSPLVVLDACSQIATLTHGFGSPWVERALHDGRFGGCLWSNPDLTVAPVPEVEAYARALVEAAPPGLDHATFVSAGGAEANEKALWLARRHVAGGASRPRVLAFQQGFHGRTWVSLGATWNPTKRGPFEMPGHEAVFAEPTLESAAALLRDRGSELYAVIIEPMMAEGGDVHLTTEFLRGLRSLTREHGIPLVVDEVQTGFATGGPFLWWNRMGLGLPGDPDTSPDLLTMAKKAQLGVVLSRWPDPAPAPVNVASVLRGLLHLEHADEQRGLEDEIRPRLEALAAAFPRVVTGPRLAGTTFAFDLPDGEAVARFIEQRFQRGFMTYQAGTRTIRFRLGAAWTPRHLDDLFARVRRGLELLDDDARTTWVPEGNDPRPPAPEIRPIQAGDWDEVLAIEGRAYEPARQTAERELRDAAAKGVGLVAVEGGAVVGFCFASPVVDHDVDGPAQDPTRGEGVTLYSVDLTVAIEARGRGIGPALKEAQVQWAREHGYRFVTGRNKVGRTGSMMAVNASLGAHPVAVHEGQYGGDGVAAYYRIPLGPPPRPRAPEGAPDLDLASGIQQPFGPAPAFMERRELGGPLASKLNLSNYATVDSIQYMEHLRLILPRGTSHLYVTSSRDETVDKSLRCLRLSRPDAHLAVGLVGGYVGHTTAAARSLSDPAGFPAPFGLYDWPRLPHPAEAGVDATVAGLDGLVAEHGAAALFGLFVELVGERSGKVVGSDDLEALWQACRRHDVPLVVVETGTGGYRSGHGAWGLDGVAPAVVPDMVLWYPGGQLGHVFVGDRYYIDKPLTLISTWDGDEVCMVRTHEHLRAAWRLDLAPAVAALGRLTEHLADAPGRSAGGAGLYRTIAGEPGDIAGLCAALSEQGVRVGAGAPGVAVLAPALDVDPARLEALIR